MTDPTSPSSKRRPRKGQFFTIEPALDDYLHGVVFENEKRLCTPPRLIIRPEAGGFPPLAETPHLKHDPQKGKGPRDWNASFSGYWLVSERLKQIFETIDPEGFAFVACDFFLADGTRGPQYYLCDVVRELDALDEEASIMKPPRIEPSGNKIYDFTGHPTQLAFKGEVVGNAHVFRTPYRSIVFCTRALRDAVKAVGKSSGERLRGLRFDDAADY